MRGFAIILATLCVALITATSSWARLSTAQIAFWDRVATCETHSQWWQHGSTYVGGLGIWYGNWWKWAPRVGVRTGATATSRIDQMRVAQYGWESERGWWGCFRVTGTPVA